MKFKFKIQQYQTEAVEHTVNVFAGQPSKTNAQYRRDLGKTAGRIVYDEEYVGWRNADVELTDAQLLDNIRKMQMEGNIPQSKLLVKQDGLGACSLDIEMETGTGKTYVYIKTMFELNKRYGWSKFIVVVPSIAIREGVHKSFAMLEDHFMELYGKKARYFVYDSSNMEQIRSFSSDASINVMIINYQAFSSSLNEDKNVEGRKGDAAARIIYSNQEDLGYCRPIDVIAANRPIIIMDEPQKLEGPATKKALKNFKPLYVLNYSATHKTSHNCIYALDAYDAYQQRLVKKIQVKGITLQNLMGAQAYIYFDSIVFSKNKAPEVKLEIEIQGGNSPYRKTLKFSQGDSLYDASKLPAYREFVITDINVNTNTVYFRNGDHISKGEVVGDVSEKTIQQVQIRETIKSHFEKERQLFQQGVKTLSLFFIDEVANYKGYDEHGEVVKGDLWKMFEKEYNDYLNNNLSLFEDDYQKYLRRFQVWQVHNGYFSIDKRTGHAKNSKERDSEDNRPAYDLILKDKERLLSFDEPTRFIFSHSALREGWDNPNVFQLCMLRHANSDTAKRQEVGRGLRICVDQQGNRMDAERLGDAVHDINKLTVIANESYSAFVNRLQADTRNALRERPTVATVAYFEGKTFMVGSVRYTISSHEAAGIVGYLFDNDYTDEKGNILPSYHTNMEQGTLASFGKKLQPISEQVHKLIQGIFDPSALDGMIEDGNETAEVVNEKLNDNAAKDEFKRLWEEINHRYVYTVHYDSKQLIKKSIAVINHDLKVDHVRYIVTTGQQGDSTDFEKKENTESREIRDVSTSTVPYDLVGDIARGATLTRKTVVSILKGIQLARLLLFKNNPEEFIRNVVKLIKEQKATMIVEHISYNQTEPPYKTDIFTQEKSRQTVDKAYPAKKHILDYVFVDSKGERKFAEDLDAADEVCVYAKLPRAFKIPTPVGNYAPDWAIAFNDNMGVKHVFFIAETKGSMDSMQLKGIEKAKIDCAKKLFNSVSTSKVRYHEVSGYDEMLNVINSLQ